MMTSWSRMVESARFSFLEGNEGIWRFGIFKGSSQPHAFSHNWLVSILFWLNKRQVCEELPQDCVTEVLILIELHFKVVCWNCEESCQTECSNGIVSSSVYNFQIICSDTASSCRRNLQSQSWIARWSPTSTVYILYIFDTWPGVCCHRIR